MNEVKLEKEIINNAANKYAYAQKCKIREMKYLHGSTQLYYAFLAGVEFAKLLMMPLEQEAQVSDTTKMPIEPDAGNQIF